SRILSAVIEAFDHVLNERFRIVNEDELEIIIKARNRLSADLEELRRKYADFRNNAPLVIGKRPAFQASLQALEQRRVEVLLRRKESELKLQGLQKAVEAKKTSFQAYEWAERSGFDKLTKEVRPAITVAYGEFLKEEARRDGELEKVLRQELEVVI